MSKGSFHFLALFVVFASMPAHACYTSSKLDLSDIQFADLVVTGRISNYTLVLDPVARQRRADFLSDPKIPSEHKHGLDGQTQFLTDYARFDVLVNEVLLGNSPTVLSVTWHNLTYGEPEGMPAGPYLIAIRNPRPDPGFTGTRVDGLVPSPDENSPVVLQTICSEPFMFPESSEAARFIRAKLSKR